MEELKEMRRKIQFFRGVEEIVKFAVDNGVNILIVSDGGMAENFVDKENVAINPLRSDNPL